MREHSYFCFIDREAFPRVILSINAPTNIHTLLSLSLSLMGKDSHLERGLDYLTANDSLPITGRTRWDPCLKIVNGGQFNSMMIVDSMPIRSSLPTSTTHLTEKVCDFSRSEKVPM